VLKGPCNDLRGIEVSFPLNKLPADQCDSVKAFALSSDIDSNDRPRRDPLILFVHPLKRLPTPFPRCAALHQPLAMNAFHRDSLSQLQI
jgi:hypothetical protein